MHQATRVRFRGGDPLALTKRIQARRPAHSYLAELRPARPPIEPIVTSRPKRHRARGVEASFKQFRCDECGAPVEYVNSFDRDPYWRHMPIPKAAAR